MLGAFVQGSKKGGGNEDEGGAEMMKMVGQLSLAQSTVGREIVNHIVAPGSLNCR
jgi:hypothetical protein